MAQEQPPENKSLQEEPEIKLPDEKEIKSPDEGLAEKEFEENPNRYNAIRNLTLSGFISATSSVVDITSAYRLLKKPLNPELLIKDSAYRKKVEASLKTVLRFEKGKIKFGKSKYETTIQNTQRALRECRLSDQTIMAHKKTIAGKYGAQIQQVYGLNKEEAEKVCQNALRRIQENPGTVPFQEAIRVEIKAAVVQKTTLEVQQDKKVGWLKKKEETKRRIKEIDFEKKDQEYLTNTQKISGFENNQYKNVIEERTKTVASELELSYNQESKQWESTHKSKPAISSTPPVEKPPSVFLSKLRERIAFKIPKIEFPKFKLPERLSNFISNISGGLGKIFGRIGGLSKTLNLRAKAMSTAVKLAANAILPGSGAILSALEKIPLIGGVMNKAYDVSSKAVIIIILIAVGIPILFVMIILTQEHKVFPQDPQNALVVTQQTFRLEKNYSWSDFEEKFLSLDKKASPTPYFAWKDFENKYFTSPTSLVFLENEK